MTLVEAQISAIRNLELIYVFTTDSVFDSSDKYVGAKVVYDNGKVFSLDYTSEFFQKFIKHIIERYEDEKNHTDITLLGDLSRRLVNESSFACLKDDDKEYSQKCILSLETKKNKIRFFMPYLKEALIQIIQFYKHYEALTIECIDGFNYNYVCKYKVGNVSMQFPMHVWLEGNQLYFEIGCIDNEKVFVDGCIDNRLNSVEINWNSIKNDLNGRIEYNSLKQSRLMNVNDRIQDIENTDTINVIGDENLRLIAFYKKLLNIDLPSKIVKVNDNSFIFGDEIKEHENEENGNKSVFFSSLGGSLIVESDYVLAKISKKNCISKYANRLLSELDSEELDITLEKLTYDNRIGILAHKKYIKDDRVSYKYEFIDLEHDVDFSKPFESIKTIEMKDEIETTESVKQMLKQLNKGGL